MECINTHTHTHSLGAVDTTVMEAKHHQQQDSGVECQCEDKGHNHGNSSTNCATYACMHGGEHMVTALKKCLPVLNSCSSRFVSDVVSIG